MAYEVLKPLQIPDTAYREVSAEQLASLNVDGAEALQGQLYRAEIGLGVSHHDDLNEWCAVAIDSLDPPLTGDPLDGIFGLISMPDARTIDDAFETSKQWVHDSGLALPLGTSEVVKGSSTERNVRARFSVLKYLGNTSVQA